MARTMRTHDGDGHPRDRGPAVELNEAEQSRVAVVEVVEELEGLLLGDEEEGVDELPVCEGSRE